ncbi:stage II sporulation protein M [Cohnella sp.]|uniref:stage II sporulation protein M n=1 Tax=Cohnella sp. TaxID=1883426 RepID=UPI0035638C48
MFTRQGLLQSWKEIRPYFIFSIILFFAGVVVGGSPSSPEEWLSQQLKGIEQISNTVNKSATPELTMFMLVASNNIFISILAMGLGIIGGILPIFMLVTNGMVLGYLFNGIAQEGHNVWWLIVKAVLPHGIIELSAVFLACAFGLRFGLTLLKGMLGSVLGKEKAWQPFVRTAIGSIPAIILVTVMLIVAAVVESTITYWIMS